MSLFVLWESKIIIENCERKKNEMWDLKIEDKSDETYKINSQFSLSPTKQALKRNNDFE